MSTEMDELLDAVIDDDGAAQAALAAFKAAFGRDATLMSACYRLRMSRTGAGDPIAPEREAEMVAALKERLAAWQPSHHPSRAAFDEAVRQVVVATLAELAAGAY